MALAHSPALDVASVRADFPILTVQGASGKPLVYLDSAASTQRPRQVIDAISSAYESCYSNVHRSGHGMSAETTANYEAGREAVRRFINARSTREIIFTPGTTASINLVARSFGDENVRAGDEILLTKMEHHSNIVPWQQLAARRGATIRWVELTDDYELDLESFDALLSERTKIVAITAVSNVLGTQNPIASLVTKAHSAGAAVLVDAAQSVPHLATDVQGWDADFVVFSGHKLLGPTGVGVLYGREALLEAMPPFLGGGSMIRTVTLDGFAPADLPAKFEAGTPPIVGAIALRPAIEYLERLGIDSIHAHEQQLGQHAAELLGDIDGLRFLGPPPEKKGGIVSFVIEGIHSKDISVALDFKGIAIREGHHCAMPLHARYNLSSSARASFYLYNTLEEVQRLADGLRGAVRMLR